MVRNMVLNEFGHTLVAVTAIKYAPAAAGRRRPRRPRRPPRRRRGAGARRGGGEDAMTERLYLEDSYRREFEAEVLESADGWCALTRTFFPGGGSRRIAASSAPARDPDRHGRPRGRRGPALARGGARPRGGRGGERGARLALPPRARAPPRAPCTS